MSKSAAAHLDRVRKLLALASSPNVHEAGLAAAKAQALIERHRLQSLLEDEARQEADPVTDGRDEPLDTARKIRTWKSALAAGLAKSNGCIAYCAVIGPKMHLLLAGRSGDRASVLALWEWLVPRIEWLSATHGAGQPRSWHESFRIGATEAIVERLAEAVIDARGAIEPGTRASAALEKLEPTHSHRRAAVENFAKERLKLRPGRSIRVDGAALEHGRDRGRRMPILTAKERTAGES